MSDALSDGVGESRVALVAGATGPIEADVVAAALIAALRDPTPGARLLKSAGMQPASQR